MAPPARLGHHEIEAPRARARARIVSDHVVQVHETGTANGVPLWRSDGSIRRHVHVDGGADDSYELDDPSGSRRSTKDRHGTGPHADRLRLMDVNR